MMRPAVACTRCFAVLLALSWSCGAARPPRPPPRPPRAPQPPNLPAEPQAAVPGGTAAAYDILNFKARVIAVALANVPGTRTYVAVNTFTDGPAVGIIDLDASNATRVRAPINHFCGAIVVLRDGRIIIIGGERSWVRWSTDGRYTISEFDVATHALKPVGMMAFPRWYPTLVRLPDEKILVVGGTAFGDRGPTAAEAELFDPAQENTTLARVAHPPPFAEAAGLNWFPFIALLPTGHILWWGDTGGCITEPLSGTSWGRVIRNLTLPRNFPYRTMYRYTASVSLLAFKPAMENLYDYSPSYTTFSLMIFGGAPSNATHSTDASNLSARLDFFLCGDGEICDSGWQVERMPGRRVMPDSTVMPNGKIIIHGGAQKGGAGLWQARKEGYLALRPGAAAFVYDPEAPLGKRYRITDSIKVARVYHSSACLDITGALLSAGSEQSRVPKPVGLSDSPQGDYEFRLTMGYLREVSPPVERPRIIAAPTSIARGKIFRVKYEYSGKITGAALAAPCSSTHSLNMGQRVLFLMLLSAFGGEVKILSPPANQPAVAQAGSYMLFLLGERYMNNGTTYSEGVWLTLADTVTQQHM